jgi:hypothetical protein
MNSFITQEEETVTCGKQNEKEKQTLKRNNRAGGGGLVINHLSNIPETLGSTPSTKNKTISKNLQTEKNVCNFWEMSRTEKNG